MAKVAKNLGNLLAEEKLTDVTLKIATGNRELKAHMAILGASSPVFMAMFEHEGTVERQTGQVEIADFDFDTMEQLLGFIYTGRIPPMETFAEQLLAAADKV